MANGPNGNSVTLYTTRAFAFQANQNKKEWDPFLKDIAIPTSFVARILDHDDERETSERELKIVVTNETGDTLLESLITPTTTFSKRSAKFGQWIDPTNEVYGLGFNSEAELDEFRETFQRLQNDILSTHSSQQHQQPLQQPQLQQQIQNQNNSALASSNQQSQTVSLAQRASLNHQSMNNISEMNGRFPTGSNGILNSAQEYSNNLAHPGDQQQQQQQLRRKRNGNISLTNGNSEASGDSNLTGYPRSQSMLGLQPKPTSGTASKWLQEPRNSPRLSQSDWQPNEVANIEQLKYENERLKQALEENSKNAGIWHNELLNLRTNNIKLTQALQESKAHVEEWERELLSLRDENKALKLRVLASESSNDPEKNNEYKKELQKYKSYIDEVQSELRRKETEIDDLQKSMQDMELKNKVSQNNEDQSAQSALNSRRQDLEVINAKLESKIKSLADIQKEFKLLVQSIGS